MSKYENNKGRFQKGNTVNVGRKHKPETIKKMKEVQSKVAYWRGKHLPESAKEKLRLGRLGEKHWNWQGGITSENEKIRGTSKFREWRKAVLERDKNQCVICKVKEIKLCADHIKQFAFYPELRFEVSNGRTLCYPCHEQTPTFGGKRKI